MRYFQEWDLGGNYGAPLYQRREIKAKKPASGKVYDWAANGGLLESELSIGEFTLVNEGQKWDPEQGGGRKI